MSNVFHRLVNLSQIVIYGIFLLISTFLMVSSCLYVFDISNMQPQRDSIFRIVLVFIFSLLIMWGISFLLERFHWKGSIVLFCIVFTVSMLFCAWWIVNAASLPAGDGQSLYDIAVRAMNHDLAPIAPVGSYMSLWPFQSGLLLYMESILRLIPEADAMTMQWINLFFIGVTEISGYFFIKRCFGNVRMANFWCILMVTCFPYFLYSNFVYGDIPSIGFIFFAVWMFTEYIRTNKIIYAIFAVFSVGLSVVVRNNSLIFVVACFLVFAVLFIMQRKKQYIILSVSLIVIAVAASKLPQKFYEYRANNIMGTGTPAVAYIAMGLQDDGGSKPGGWNGYHSNLMIEYDFDSEKVAEISKQSLEESLYYMLHHPMYVIDFFNRKLTWQWCDENFGCFYCTKNLYEPERTDKAWSIYEGEWNSRLLTFMNWHQSIVYIGAFLFTFFVFIRWLKRRKKSEKNINVDTLSLWKLIFAVTIIGGFLFSMMWEGGSRYIFPYFIMLLPYSAKGLCDTSQFLEKKLNRLFCAVKNERNTL